MKNFFATAASVLVLGLASSAMAQSSTSTVLQYGVGNGVDIGQIATGAINDSTVRQGTNYGSSNNYAKLRQDGSFVQRNNSLIDQDGNGNSATVTQGGVGLVGDTNNSTVDQDGASNVVTVEQANVALNNNSNVQQSGTENYATVEQGGDEGNNVNNTSSLTQSGYSNEAHVKQGGGNATNSSIITQADSIGLGGNNYASVDQRGNSLNFSNISQDGTLNSAIVSQSAANGVTNSSSVTQAGNSNWAIVNQN